MNTVADTLGISRSNLVQRLKGRPKPRGAYNKAENAELLPAVRRLVDQKPTYGYQRIAALLNRERRAADQHSYTAYAFSDGPSGTRPSSTKRQIATASFRASAVTRRIHSAES